MIFVKKSLYIFMYGKKQADEIIAKRIRRKRILSIFIPLCAGLGFVLGLNFVQCLFLAVLVWGLIWIAPEILMQQKCTEMKNGFKLQIPDFLDITALLLEAGQPLWYAVRQASCISEEELCRRINSTLEKKGDMEAAGNPEILLNELAQSLKVAEVSSAVSVIVQNSRKGERELATVLRLQSSICRQERKTLAQEMGNRASNLPLIPSGMVFAAVLMMLAAPAVMQLGLF